MKVSKNNIEPTIDQVREFLLGDLPQEKRDEFENRLSTDESFKEEFMNCKTILAGIEYHFDLELKNKLESSYSKKDLVFRKWVIAAVSAMFIVVSVLLIKQQGSPSKTSSDLFIEYYKPYYNLINNNTRSDSNSTIGLSDPFLLYEYQQYEKAILVFDSQLLIEPGNDALRFYLGLCHLQLGNENLAIENLRASVNSFSNLSEPAEWYLALSYVKFQKINEAKITLSKIKKSESSYSKRAGTLLDKLDRIE